MDKELSEICKDVQTRMEMRKITDKNRGGHDFMGLYSQIFEPYRDSATAMFEIGVRHGGSLLMWQDYFKAATVYGLDIKLRRARISRDDKRIKLLQLDQSDKAQLIAFAEEYGPFDIGIDDGSHIWSHQILTFETLWPYIKPGGTFVIEDTCTSYDAWVYGEGQTRTGRNYNEAPPSCVEYFKKLIDHLNFEGEDYNLLHINSWSEYQRTIDWVSFRNNVIVVKKRADA